MRPRLADPAPAIEVRTFYLARALVDCGAGDAIGDESTASSAGKDGSLGYIEPELSIGAIALTSESQPSSHVQQVLIDQLRAKLVHETTRGITKSNSR